jgi:hypothetical protein
VGAGVRGAGNGGLNQGGCRFLDRRECGHRGMVLWFRVLGASGVNDLYRFHLVDSMEVNVGGFCCCRRW